MSKKVAVILSGCGFLDGAEIRESVLTLLHLDEAGADVKIFAPNEDQHHVINHLKSEEESQKRNILEESARIARCKVEALEELKADQFDALVMPGGFGVAKNLCDFAFKGSAGTPHPVLKTIITDFHSSGKPIAAICISPALMALCLGDKGIEVTIGKDPETASEIEKLGAKHKETEASECVVDKENKVVTTAAYMFDSAPLSQINKGISSCIKETLSLA